MTTSGKSKKPKPLELLVSTVFIPTPLKALVRAWTLPDDTSIKSYVATHPACGAIRFVEGTALIPGAWMFATHDGWKAHDEDVEQEDIARVAENTAALEREKKALKR